MIEEHPSALRADIARYFPDRSLNEFHRNETGNGSMTWLELWEFFLALPADSMTASALSGDHARRRWTERDYMQASLLSLQQFMIQVVWAGNLEGKPPAITPWTLPDLRTAEQIEADQAREADLERRRAAFRAATRPGATDPEYARKLEQAREEHLRLMHHPD